jgi:hypothetical protein
MADNLFQFSDFTNAASIPIGICKLFFNVGKMGYNAIEIAKQKEELRDFKNKLLNNGWTKSNARDAFYVKQISVFKFFD